MPALLTKTGKFECVFAATRTEGSARAFTKAWGVPAGTDYGELAARHRPAAVLVAAPTSVLDVISLDFLAAGIHVLCETPGGVSYSGFERNAAVALKNKAALMIATPLRYSPVFRRFKSELERLKSTSDAPPQFEIVCNGNYRHFFDLLSWFHPAPVRRITGCGKLSANRVEVEYADGARAKVVSTTHPGGDGMPEKIGVTFKTDSLEVINREDMIAVTGSLRTVERFSAEQDLASAFSSEWDCFHSLVTGTGRNDSDAISVLNGTKFYDLARRAVACQGSITLP